MLSNKTIQYKVCLGPGNIHQILLVLLEQLCRNPLLGIGHSILVLTANKLLLSIASSA